MPSKTSTQNENSLSTAFDYDWGLLTIVISLLALGLIMVFSSSYAQALTGYNDPFYFVFRQVMWAATGLVALVFAARIRYTLWERWSIILMGAALLALILVLTFGVERFGSSRTFWGGSIQPSEPAKIIIIIYISTWLASKGVRIRDVRVGLVPFSVLMGFITVLIVFQPDISSALLIMTTALILFFIAGADLKQLVLVGIGTAMTFWLVITNSTYASARIDKYLESIWNPMESAEWQVRHSVEAFARGGPVGVGVGNSLGKLPGYLPLSWSDNIFAIIGEEMGLLGTLLVIMLFALLAYRGLRTALRAPDNFGMLLATGITSLLILQALLNAAVVVAAAPPTGVTLPFISYGGSSLVTTLGAVGILLSISRYSRDVSQPASQVGKLAYARFDFGWGDRGARLPRSGRSATAKKSSRTTSGRASTGRAKTGRKSTSRTSTGRTSTGRGRTGASRSAQRTATASRTTAGRTTKRRKSSSA